MTTSSPGAHGSSKPSSPGTNIAFLVHSPHTLNQNLPPHVDNKSFARQRRRRTSPDDQKILEEEFLRDPRPNKASRLDIVSRVTLGEKEVQIWFQNRRQYSRKKNKTDESSDLSLEGHSDSSSNNMAVETGLSHKTTQQTSQENSTNVIDCIGQAIESQSSVLTSIRSSTSVQLPSSQNEFSSQGISLSSQTSNTSGYVADRRIVAAREKEDEERYLLSQRDSIPVSQARTLQRSGSSHLRLSLTADGKASVVDRGVTSPQKQEKTTAPTPTARAGGLRRSYSAAGLQDRPKSLNDDVPDPARKVPRVTGRSRDSRTWEFWCDSDARNTLIERAQQERSGSAAEALSMIRSKSNRALKPNVTKLNSSIPGHSRFEVDLDKTIRPPLKKSFTHVGIVSTVSKKVHAKPVDVFEDDDYDHLNSESDKENYDPDPRPSTRKAPFIRTSASKVLGENDTVKSQSSSLGELMNRELQQKTSAKRRDGKPVKVDDEVAAFMGKPDGSGASAGIAREEDLDCIQGLLSLSQGNWA